MSVRVFPDTLNQYDEPNIGLLGFRKRRCIKIVLNEKTNKCGCMKDIEHHDDVVLNEYRNRKSPLPPDYEWKAEVCTEDDGPSDAYGRIKFDENDELAHYVRVSFKDSFDKVKDLLFKKEYWGLKKPELIISVTGGAKKILLNPKLKEAFSKGLVRAAVTTNALVTSGGTNGGCMKLIGEAFKLNALSIDPNKKVNVLGIASWGSTFDNKKLVRPADPTKLIAPVEYVSVAPKNSKKAPLDPNHTHFILVDDANNYFGGEIDFRSKLEHELCDTTVVLVLGGGPNTVKSIKEAIENGTPCVILESSGEMEYGFSYAINRIKSVSNKEEQLNLLKKEEFWNEVRRRLENGYMALKDRETRADKSLKLIQSCLSVENGELKYLHLLNVCRSRNGQTELDVAILEALLNSKKEIKFDSQLNLALNWNRIDIARNYLFNDDNREKICSLENFMTIALIENKYEFVELFLENEFSFKNYLTRRRLLFLYNKIEKTNSSLFHKMVEKHSLVDTTKAIIKENIKQKPNANKNLITFELIGKILTEIVNYMYEDKFKKYPFSEISKNKTHEIILMGSNRQNNISGIVRLENGQDFTFDEEFDNPEHEMFILNVLLCRFEMAMLFLTRSKNSICSALIGTKICKYYAEEFDDDLNKREVKAKDFENLACDILKLFNEKDEISSQLTLVRKIKEFGNVTCMKVATSSQDLNFIAMQSFQNLLDRIWYHKMLPDTNKFKIALCMACPFLAPILKFRKKANQLDDKAKKTTQLLKTQTQSEYKKISAIKAEDPENLLLVEDDDTLIKKIDAKFSNEFFDRGIDGDYNYFEYLYHFLNTPLVKFTYHQIWYLFFLILFSYVILCDFRKINDAKTETSLGLGISIPEIVLMIWVFAFVSEEIRKFFKDDMKKYYLFYSFFGDIWQKINLGAILLYIVAFILRFIDDKQCYEAARIIMAIDIILWFLRSLKAYTFLRQLGPKLYMIKEMLIQLVYFFLIVILFMFAFGVSSNALMFKNQNLDKNLLKNIFLPSYFMIGGEYYTRNVIMEASAGQCTDPEAYPECPEEIGASVTLALYVIYLIFLNILLVNLLIAIFNNTYDTIELEANKIWKSQRYSLVFEYYNKPPIPAPFVMINYIFSLIKIIFRIVAKTFPKGPKKSQLIKNLLKNRYFRFMIKKWTHTFVYELEESEEKKIIKLEEYLTNELMSTREKDINDNFEIKVEKNYDKLDNLALKFEEFMEKGNQTINDKIQSIDENIKKINELIKFK